MFTENRTNRIGGYERRVQVDETCIVSGRIVRVPSNANDYIEGLFGL